MTAYSDTQPDTPRNRGDYNAPHMTPVTAAEDIRTIMLNRVSWGAVSAGVVMALVIHLLLNLFGVGLGAAAVSVADGGSAAQFSIGAAIWWTVSGVIAAFAGGFTAGRLAGEPLESTAGWHGLTSWAASILIIAALVTAGAGILMGGTLNSLGIGNIMVERTDGGAVGTAMSGAGMEDDTALTGGYPGDTADQPVVRVQNGGRTVEADTTDISRAALFSGIALVLGALASWFGGRMGAVKPTVTSGRLRREPLH